MVRQAAFFDALRYREQEMPPRVNLVRHRQKRRGTSGYLLLALLLFYALCAVAAIDAPTMEWLATPSP